MTEKIAATSEFPAPDASTRVEALAPPTLETKKVRELASDQLGKFDNMLSSFEIHGYSEDESDQELVDFYLSLDVDDKTPEDLKLAMKAAALGSITSDPLKDFATSRLRALFESVSENESDDWVFGNLERRHKLLLEQDREERVLSRAKQLSFIN